jgi:serine protease Do
MRRGVAALLAFAAGCGAAMSDADEPRPILTTAEIARRAMLGVVRIEITRHDGGNPLGTGFIVDRSGKIVTNWHVIEDAASGVIHMNDGRRLTEIEVLAIDKEHDLAILLARAKDLRPLPLAKGLPEPGEKVVAIGHPRGLTNSISDGIVSAIRADGVRDRQIQMTAPISPGNSGGPVLNERGEVVGVSQSIRIDGQNLNFAVPVGYVKELLVADEPLPLGTAARAPRSRILAGCSESERELVHKTLWRLVERVRNASRTIDAQARFKAFEEAALDLSIDLKSCDGVRRLVLAALARAESGDDGPKDKAMILAFEKLIQDVRTGR